MTVEKDDPPDIVWAIKVKLFHFKPEQAHRVPGC
jgi:hypothetical protein